MSERGVVKIELNRKDLVKLVRKAIEGHDYVKVTRCENCIFYQDGLCTFWTADPYEYNPVEPFDYCSKGEVDNA